MPYFLYDGHGSTRLLTDAEGGVTAQYTYDSYGVMLGQTAGAQARQATDLLYSGERFDPVLQHYYLRARDYNPANGQFTSLDPYSGSPHDPQSLHKYAYCHSDPVNGIDPSGEFTLAEMGVAGSISAGISLAVNIMLFRGEKSIGRMLGEALFSGIAGALMVPVAAIVPAILSIGAFGFIAAAFLLGTVSCGIEFLQQVIFDGEVDKEKLLCAFAVGCFGGFVTLLAGECLNVPAESVIMNFMIPYMASLGSGFFGKTIDALRNWKKSMNRYKEEERLWT